MSRDFVYGASTLLLAVGLVAALTSFRKRSEFRN